MPKKLSISFERACTLIEGATAILLDHDALSFPEVDDKNKEIIVNYCDEGNDVSRVFDDTDDYMINENHNIIVTKPNAKYCITLLTTKKAK